MAGVLGNVSFTEYIHDRSIKVIKAVWQTGSGDNNGTAWGTTTNVFDGQVVAAVCVTANTPQNAYNVRAIDALGMDVLISGGLNCLNTVNEPVVKGTGSLGAVSQSKLNIYIANANFNRNGTVYLYIR